MYHHQSQGLALPLDKFPDIWQAFHKTRVYDPECPGHMDVTDMLGVLKFELPIPAELSGIVKGNFPTFIPRTIQRR